jgi:hypothetical protein
MADQFRLLSLNPGELLEMSCREVLLGTYGHHHPARRGKCHYIQAPGFGGRIGG